LLNRNNAIYWEAVAIKTKIKIYYANCDS